MTFEEKAEALALNLSGLGYEKRNRGEWFRKATDTGAGFPEVTYTCPFCKTESATATKYCPECGARLDNAFN